MTALPCQVRRLDLSDATAVGSLAVPLGALVDRVVADPAAREAARAELARLDAGGGLDAVKDDLVRLVLAAQDVDPWTRLARPAFLYVMYALLLWAIPLGVIAAIRPAMAMAVAHGMTGYLAGIPEPLYALFGTGYLGYTAARSWGKAKGIER